MAVSIRLIASPTAARMPASPVASPSGGASTGVFSTAASGAAETRGPSSTAAVPGSTAAILAASPVAPGSTGRAGSCEAAVPAPAVWRSPVEEVVPAMVVCASPVEEVAPESAVCASPVEEVAPESAVCASPVEEVAPESAVCASPVEDVAPESAVCASPVEEVAPESAVCASPARDVTSLLSSASLGRSSANHSPTPIAATTSRMTSVRRPARSVGCSASFGTRHFLFPARSTGGVGLRPGGLFRHRRPKPGPTGETDVSHYCNSHDTPSHDAEWRRRHRPIPDAANRPRHPESASPRPRRVQVATGPTSPVSFPRTVQHAR